MRPPGVYGPQADTDLLTETLIAVGVPAGARVLDIGTGTGALAVAAARAGAGSVTAVDVSRRAVLAARFNATVRRLPVRVCHGDVFEQAAGQRFDVIVANPPYVPAERGTLPVRGRARAWDAGTDGRALLDPICARAPDLLAPGGMLLVVHSVVSGVEASLRRLNSVGMTATVVARRTERFGPVMRGRRRLLRERGLISGGQRHEELVVIRADRQGDA
ncbi:MAG TPA: HemK2/MTQ2 family protein methyltransferase [Nocardioidaceae bacterium]|nr:HemK2/MTQ2 family protein methyltransferase [Nocardioidaceae bacterium]